MVQSTSIFRVVGEDSDSESDSVEDSSGHHLPIDNPSLATSAVQSAGKDLNKAKVDGEEIYK